MSVATLGVEHGAGAITTNSKPNKQREELQIALLSLMYRDRGLCEAISKAICNNSNVYDLNGDNALAIFGNEYWAIARNIQLHWERDEMNSPMTRKAYMALVVERFKSKGEQARLEVAWNSFAMSKAIVDGAPEGGDWGWMLDSLRDYAHRDTLAVLCKTFTQRENSDLKQAAITIMQNVNSKSITAYEAVCELQGMIKQSNAPITQGDAKSIVNNCEIRFDVGTATVQQDVLTVPLSRWINGTEALALWQEGVQQNISYDPSDMGNAEIFRDTYRESLRYVTAWKKWIIWDGNRWIVDDRQAVVVKAMDVVKTALPTVAQRIDDVEKRGRYFKHIAASQARARVDNMIALAGPLMAVTVVELDSDPLLFNCQNGTIDCRTGELRPHDRADMLTKISLCSFDPNATAPTWIKFLERIFQSNENVPRTDLIEFMQRAMGYCLTGSVSEHCLFILYGNGRNGKSTFLNVLAHVMGDYNMTSQSALLMSDYRKVGGAGGEDVAALLGVRAVSCIETREGKSFDEEKVKALTGGDKLRARRLYENSFEFAPTHKILLATNHKPTIRGNDWGIWSRINLIPFDATIGEDEKDVRLADKLRAEGDGILAWMVEGLKRYNAMGKLAAPAIVKDKVEKYREESDIFGQFLAGETEQSPTATAKSGALYSAYQRWCKDNGNDYPLTHHKFAARLQERGFERLKPTAKGTFYRGLSLVDDTSATESFASNNESWNFE